MNLLYLSKLGTNTLTPGGRKTVPHVDILQYLLSHFHTLSHMQNGDEQPFATTMFCKQTHSPLIPSSNTGSTGLEPMSAMVKHTLSSLSNSSASNYILSFSVFKKKFYSPHSQLSSKILHGPTSLQQATLNLCQLVFHLKRDSLEPVCSKVLVKNVNL